MSDHDTADRALVEALKSSAAWLEDQRLYHERDVMEDAAAALARRIAEGERLKRHAWEAGFNLAVSYGDNWIHFDGEQKERQWKAYCAEAKP